MLHARALLLAVTLALGAPLVQAQGISADLTQLPKRAQATHKAMLAAARAGDIAALQAIIDGQSGPIQLGFGGAETAEEFATTNSQVGDGLDTLADLVDILELPYEAMEDGEGSTFYIWPYLAGADLTSLSRADTVAAYQIIDPGSLPDFIEYGGWVAMRTIIDANGDWSAWVLGD